MRERAFLAKGLTGAEWSIVEKAKLEAERQSGSRLSNREFLVAVCNDTRWRKDL